MNRNKFLEIDVAILVLIVLGPNGATVFIESSCLLWQFFWRLGAIYVDSGHIEEDRIKTEINEELSQLLEFNETVLVDIIYVENTLDVFPCSFLDNFEIDWFNVLITRLVPSAFVQSAEIWRLVFHD